MGLHKDAKGVIEDLMELVDEPPDKNCSCHTGVAPCSDCVDNSFTRSVFLDARETLKKLQAVLLIAPDS